jgi:hypothetical protein
MVEIVSIRFHRRFPVAPSGSAEPQARPEPGADHHEQRTYFHSQSLLFVFPSASASYSKTVATAFSRLSFVDSL